MALVEGGAFRCYKDGFETTDIKVWNEHCSKKEGDTTHIVEFGSTLCIKCGERFEFTDLPFQKLDARGSKNIAMKCEECEANEIGKATKRTKIVAAGGSKAK